MRNLILLLVLVAGGVTGYFIGSYRGKAAIEALAAVKQAALQEKAEADKTVKALEEKMAGLSTEHKNELDKIESDYRQQLAKLGDALAGKEKKLKELSAQIDSNRQEIDRLRNTALSTTDPAERQKLLDQIAQLEKANRNLQSGVDGFRCLSVAIPDEIVRQLQGVQP